MDQRPNERRLNMILMTTLAIEHDPLFFDLKDGTNNAATFLAFIQSAAAHGRIPRGSIVVWDNARIHNAQQIVHDIDRILQQCGAQRVNLPAYSPEFNVCELVFAELKCFLRNQPRLGVNLTMRVLEAAGRLSYKNLLAYYEHCTSVALRVQ